MEAICNVDVCVWKRVSEIQLLQPYERPESFQASFQDPCSVLLEPPQLERMWSQASIQAPAPAPEGHRSLSKCSKMWSALHSRWMNSVPEQIDYKLQKN